MPRPAVILVGFVLSMRVLRITWLDMRSNSRVAVGERQAKRFPKQVIPGSLQRFMISLWRCISRRLLSGCESIRL